MAFLKGQKDTITLETIATYDDDLGKTGKDTFRTTWKTMKVSEKQAIKDALPTNGWDVEAEIRARLIGWSGLKDRDIGDEVEFSSDRLDEMFEVQAYLDALVANLRVLMLGHQAVQEKN